MIHVENLVKRFGDLTAVDRLGFEVQSGEIYGLLGPNGAGKTTTLSMLAGLLRPDDGLILYDGVDLAAQPLVVKAKLGVVPQENALYADLSAREHLRFWGGLYDLRGSELRRAVARVLDWVGLAGRADEPVKRFSGGMKRRLNLALGLVHSPQAVLLDEPTVGIDPQARLNILEVVRQVAAAGASVIYTTHYLEEAEELCDHLTIVDHGRAIAHGTLAELQQMVGGEEIVTLRGSFAAAELGERLAERGVRVLAAEPERLVLAVSAARGGRGSVDLLAHVFAGDVAVESVAIEPPSLSGLFLKLTGRELRD